MEDEVSQFAQSIQAIDLKQILTSSKYSGLFKRRNYFLIEKGKFLIIKISRNKIKPFFGLGKTFIDLFNMLTENGGTYYFVGLVTSHSGWVISKNQILNQINNGSLSYSIKDGRTEYKINTYNLRGQNSFRSPDGFLKLIESKTG